MLDNFLPSMDIYSFNKIKIGESQLNALIQRRTAIKEVNSAD